GLNYGILAGAEPQVVEALPYPAAQALADTLGLGCLLFNNGGLPGTPNSVSSNCGDDLLAAQRARGIRNVSLVGQPDDYIKTGAVIDQFKWDLTEQLAIRNIASYGMLKHSFRWDFFGGPAFVDNITNPTGVYSTNAGQFTEELQLQGTALDSRLKFVIGGYYQN